MSDSTQHGHKMVPGRPNLGQLLREQRVISSEDLDRAIQYQILHGGRLGEALVQLGICTDVNIAQVLAKQLEVPYIDLEKTPPLPSFVALLPAEVAREYGVLPVRMQGRHLLVAALDPFDIRADEAVRAGVDMPVILCAAPESQLRRMLRQYFAEDALEESDLHAAEMETDLHGGGDRPTDVEGILDAGGEVSTIRLVNTLIADAVRKAASDIHIEPDEKHVRVRYRIDGVLHTIVTLKRRLLPSMSARVKIMASMDIAENRKPQDGSCRVRVNQRSIELRCSTLPGVHGEIVVIRLLTQDQGLPTLEELGFLSEPLRAYRALMRARQGMFLITGPTGSGKSTTLYATLAEMNSEELNIVTVEDPVEMAISGVNQVQVHDRAGRTFPGTLRSMLRQDPDIIMVGEIRDLETAEIALRAALTGHLVLSTLHTQNSLVAPPRLTDMGLPSYLIAASLNGVLAQRLLRRVCKHCAAPYQTSSPLRAALEAHFGDLSHARFARGAGCNECHQTGMLGRVGVYELLTIDEDLRRLIVAGASPSQLEARVRAANWRSMEEDAFHKACLGMIPPEEVLALGMNLAMLVDPATGRASTTGASATMGASATLASGRDAA